MKKTLRITVVTLTLLALLLAAVPASAEVNRTEVPGKIYLLYELPAEQQWVTGEYVAHFRNNLMVFQYVTSDPRLDGYALLNNNGDSHYTPEWTHLFTHIWASFTIYAEPEFLTPKWECTDTGSYDADFNFYGLGVCHGVGENFGLDAKLTITLTDWSLDYVVLQAEIK